MGKKFWGILLAVLMLTVSAGALADMVGTSDGIVLDFWVYSDFTQDVSWEVMKGWAEDFIANDADVTGINFTGKNDNELLTGLMAGVGLPDAFSASARENGFGVIIAAAGMAAHLAGSLAANTTLPVIGIPMKSTAFANGMDALLSTVQMPSGIPVATVAVYGAVNAALLACEILAVTDDALAARLAARRAADTQKVLAANADCERQYNG